MAVEDRNFFDEGLDTFDYNFNAPPMPGNPMQGFGGNEDAVLKDVIEDIRMRSESYGKDQVQGSIYNSPAGMQGEIPELMGPGSAANVSAERSLANTGFGQVDSYGMSPQQNPQLGNFQSSVQAPVSAPGYYQAAESRPYDHVAYQTIMNNPPNDISNQSPQSAVPPSSADLNDSAGRLGFIVGNN